MVELRLPRTRKETTQLFVVLLAAGVSVAGALALAQRQREKKLLKDGPRRAPKKSHKVGNYFVAGPPEFRSLNPTLTPFSLLFKGALWQGGWREPRA